MKADTSGSNSRESHKRVTEFLSIGRTVEIVAVCGCAIIVKLTSTVCGFARDSLPARERKRSGFGAFRVSLLCFCPLNRRLTAVLAKT